MSSSPTFLDRLFRVLTVFLALGNLAWFVLTFPSYFRWFNTGWMSPGLPLFVLWFFLGLPSLVCAVVALRRAATHGGAGILLKLAFLAILGVCACVPLFGSFARWTADAQAGARFPWVLWLVVIAVALGLMAYALRGPKEVEPEPQAADDKLKPAS